MPAEGRPPEDVKRRLEELLTLAEIYRGWSRKQLAAELDRDVHNLVPASGLPKLDLLVRIAVAMDWTVQDVTDDLWGSTTLPVTALQPGDTWDSLDRAAYAALVDGRYRDLVGLARRGQRAANNATQRAQSCVREFLGLDGIGRYELALKACQRGLREVGRDRRLTVSLQLNAANAHALLGDLPEARAMATVLIDSLTTGSVDSVDQEAELGIARYVMGNCCRVCAGADPEDRELNARRALHELTACQPLLLAASERPGFAMHRGAAHAAEAGALEMKALLGEVPPKEALAVFLRKLDDVVDPTLPGPVMLESYGWWSICGCNVALRHVEDESQLEQLMAIFTNKADEIAELLGNWTLRERVWTLELGRRKMVDSEEEWVIDRDDARAIAGTMSRFPLFRETGWQVLRSSRVIEE